MALTLAEGAKLSNDVLLEGVIETVINDSPVLQRLPFVEIVGNGLTYNRENAAATAAFYAVGETWTEDTPTFTQITATLKILGGDADVDNYLARTRNNVQDLEAAVLALKAKAVQRTFDDTFIDGDTGADAEGLRRHRPALRRRHRPSRWGRTAPRSRSTSSTRRSTWCAAASRTCC